MMSLKINFTFVAIILVVILYISIVPDSEISCAEGKIIYYKYLRKISLNPSLNLVTRELKENFIFPLQNSAVIVFLIVYNEIIIIK